VELLLYSILNAAKAVPGDEVRQAYGQSILKGVLEEKLLLAALNGNHLAHTSVLKVPFANPPTCQYLKLILQRPLIDTLPFAGYTWY
jgi:hypothetical protein